MFEAFVATFFDGLEAFLVVAVAVAFFRKSRRGLVVAAQLGLAGSVVASVMAAWLFSSANNPEWWLWLLSVGTAAFVAVLAADVWRATRRAAAEREGRLQPEDPTPSGAAWLIVFAGTVLVVARGGMLIVLLFASLIFQIGAFEVTVAAATGTAGAALLSWLWSRYAHRLAPRTVMTVTAAFVLIFLSHLLISDILGLWQNRLWLPL